MLCLITMVNKNLSNLVTRQTSADFQQLPHPGDYIDFKFEKKLYYVNAVENSHLNTNKLNVSTHTRIKLVEVM